ncbi:MAG: FkbM family methyltransferase [Methylobacter sp.]|jgi:FkbM family methyltransferase|uniref:FkbM family methyltransferase n=1 Tax=Methylobacter sp. TaxID=2051955 RepID=UPI0025F2F758|nr:FkbM family methyltransferase [Methylobacter sp.]MCK9621259.1 FkbM family methyltransferase [Methylobacter sp.]
MNISDTRSDFLKGDLTKPEFIRTMYQLHHAKLFEYANYIKQTNIASIEISDGSVVMTSRDKGVKMICPLGDHRVAPIEALNFLDYETTDSTMIMRLVSPEDCVIDIGANAGWYAVNIAKTYPASTVHAFEPIPKTYDFLEKNIKLNQVSNVVAHHFGLSDECKDLTFYFYPEGSVNASAANVSERMDAELITCHVERLDDFVSANKLHVDFIKCDVEGAELFAFQGAIETLQRDKPIVFTEMLRKWAAKFNYHPNEIISLFASFEYRCFYADGAALKELVEMTDKTVETNFFFLHAKKHQQLIDELSNS